jgi:hypothetical protein
MHLQAQPPLRMRKNIFHNQPGIYLPLGIIQRL